jgi:3'(2'), 5'-bisphosphate nucleotidase
MSDETLLELAIHAGIEAGREILEVYAKPFRVNYKEDDSPVTAADMRASQVIVQRLEKTKIPVISEEHDIPSYEQRKDFSELWLVDPLDGTKEFVKKNGEFSVNIGLVKEHYPMLGIVYMPVLKELYFAAPSVGAHKIPHEVFMHHDLTKMSLQEIIPLSKKLPSQKPVRYTIVASRSHLSKETYAHIQRVKYEKGEPDIIYSGSSVKMCWVAEGRANEYPRFGRTMEWDTAAGQAIVECAGGTFVNADTGKRLSYNKESLLNPSFIVRM